MDTMFDDAMQQVCGNDYGMTTMGAPWLKVIEPSPQSITFADFARGALRGAEQVKTVSVLIDYVENVNADINLDHIVASLASGKPEKLPASLRPTHALPKGARTQFIFQTMPSGSYNIVRSIWFSKPLQQTQASALISGMGYEPSFEGPLGLEEGRPIIVGAHAWEPHHLEPPPRLWSCGGQRHLQS